MLALIIASTGILFGRTEKTETSLVHGYILQFAVEDIITNGKPFPISFDGISGLREMLDKRPTLLRNINELALVPSAPAILPEKGIPRDLHGQRLFAIGRRANLDYDASNEGRYSIIMSADGSDGTASWIPETQVQIILGQIKGFDPENQPLAFQDLKPIQPKKKLPELFQFDQTQRNHKSKKQAHPEVPLQRQTEGNRLFWIAGGSVSLLCLIWLFMRKLRAAR